jgi:F0F1-type ATP synthase epsilon subunit
MEMPCRCDCGEWFDLNDGHSTLERSRGNIVVCDSCHDKELDRERIENKIEELEDDTQNTGKGHKREIKKLQKELNELGGSLNEWK